MARKITEDIQVGKEQFAREVVATSRGVRTHTYDVTVNGRPAGTIVKDTGRVTSKEWAATDARGETRLAPTLYVAMSVLAHRAQAGA